MNFNLNSIKCFFNSNYTLFFGEYDLKLNYILTVELRYDMNETCFVGPTLAATSYDKYRKYPYIV